jgi:hypothetical protein
MFTIVDTTTQEVVATRKTLAAARTWVKKLNDGLAGRYTVSTLKHV